MAQVVFYNSFKKALLDADIDFAADTIKVALLDNGYTPDVDAHDNFDDVSGDEVSGSGYSAGGATLANKLVLQDNINDRAIFDADDVVWSSVTVTNARYAVLYKSTGVASTSKLIGYIDLGADFNPAGNDLALEWDDDDGIFSVLCDSDDVTFFADFYESLCNADIDLDNDTIKVALLTDSWTPDISAHDNFDDVSAYEASGAGYSAGGATITNTTTTQDNTNDAAVFDGDDVSWASCSATFRYLVLYKSTGVASTSKLIGYIDRGQTQNPGGATLTHTWPAAGIFRIR